MKAWNAVLPHIARRITGAVATAFGSRSLSGGCINQAIKLTLRDQAYFVKLNRADSLDMFETEAAGLEALATAGAIRTPGVVCSGQWEDHAYLVLEYIPLQKTGDPALAGRQLAALHRATGRHYGWKQDNYIGATPQPNTPDDSWVEFWHGQRLGFQLALAERRGYGGALQVAGARLLGRLPALLDHNPSVSLLHGDLWSGNLGYDRNGAPVIYDPAVYYGDRECDLAMSELFGGFSEHFYRAYDEAWPLDAGYATRKTLYNLYHILNHLNLFGGGYGRQALAMIDRLLAELGD
jgi:fructosamine-3-kinase